METYRQQVVIKLCFHLLVYCVWYLKPERKKKWQPQELNGLILVAQAWSAAFVLPATLYMSWGNEQKAPAL